MATGAVWTQVPGVGQVLQDPGTSGLQRGKMIPWNADAEHYASTGNLRITGTTGEGTSAVAAGLGTRPAPGWEDVSSTDVAPGGGREGLAELARTAASGTGMSPYETLAQTIELAATFGDLSGVAPGYEGSLTANEVSGWINDIQQSGDPWAMVEKIRHNILQYRVTPARVAETYGITAEQAEMLTAPGGDIKGFLASGKTEIVNRKTGAATTIGTGLPGAEDVIKSTLRRWGFTTDEISTLGSWIREQLQTGVDIESVLTLIYDQPGFQSRFPGMKAATDAGYAPPSPDDYIEYEDGLREYIDRYLPNEAPGDIDTLVTTLMGGNISLIQVQSRLQIAYDEILNAPVDVKSWFLQEYGQSADAMLATVLLDPKQSFTDLEQTAKESYTQAAASEILSNTITKDTARKIASLGYTQESQYRQFTDLAKQEFLYVEKLTEGDDLRMEREGVGSAFGIDLDASRSVTEREEERLSEFAGGGGAYVGTGITGFGVANA